MDCMQPAAKSHILWIQGTSSAATAVVNAEVQPRGPSAHQKRDLRSGRGRIRDATPGIEKRDFPLRRAARDTSGSRRRSRTCLKRKSEHE